MSTTLYQTNFDSVAPGVVAGVAQYSTANFSVGTVNPVSGTQAFGTTAAANNQVVIFGNAPQTAADGDVVFSQQIVGTYATLMGPILRADSSYNNAYVYAVNVGGANLFSRIGGTYSAISSGAFNFSSNLPAGTVLWQRMRITGTTIQYRHWLGTLAAEPTTWDVTTTDSSITAAGSAGFYVGVPSGGPTSASIDDLTITTTDTTATLTPGTLTTSAVTNTTLTVTTTAATGGTKAGYTYQFQRATGSGAFSSVGTAGTSLTYNDTGLASGTTYRYQVVVADSAANTATSANVSVTTTGTASVVPIGAATAGFNFTGRWNLNTSTGTATTINDGAQCEFGYTGGDTCTLCFDVSTVSTVGVGAAPVVAYWVDGVGPTRATTAANVSNGVGTVTLTIPHSSTAHAVRFMAVVDSCYTESGVNNWTSQTQAMKFLGVALGSGGALLPSAANPNTIEFLGDSITAGLRILYTGSNGIAGDAPELSWPIKVAHRLGLAPVINGHGGQGLTTTSTDGAPVANQAFAYTYSGVPYAPTSKPAVVVIYQGTNDSGGSVTAATFQAAYLTFLQTVRAAYPLASIFAVTPDICATYDAGIAAAVTAMSDANIFHLNYSGDTVYVASTDTPDGLHPSVGGCAKLAARLASDIQARLATLGVGYQATTTTTSGGITLQQLETALASGVTTLAASGLKNVQLEPGVSLMQGLSVIAAEAGATLAGSTAGASTVTIAALGNPGTTRVTALCDQYGNRTTVTLNLPVGV